MMLDDRRSQRFASHQRLPVLFAGDVASKPGRLMYPSPVLKAACLSEHHRLGTCYWHSYAFQRQQNSRRKRWGEHFARAAQRYEARQKEEEWSGQEARVD